VAVDIAIVEELKDRALEVRKWILELACKRGGLHVGGDLSMTDAMVAMFNTMRKDPQNPKWPERDRFILSKGHGAGCLYIVLAQLGYFDKNLPLTTYNAFGSAFGMHPTKNIPGVEIPTGSLGHGLPISVGVALAGRLNGADYRVFTLMGDGEVQEGSVWEAAMAAHQYKLGNLVAVIDRNQLSLDGLTEETMALEPLAAKWEAFGWNAISVDGHDMGRLVEAFNNLPAADSDKPTVIIANTVKGKGISFMEMVPDWHAGSVDTEQLEVCYAELDDARNKERR